LKYNIINNYPNPFNPTTTISFALQDYANIELTFYNLKGEKVKTFANNKLTKGNHSMIWSGNDDSGQTVSSGIYLYKLNVNGKTEAMNKCVMLK